MNRAAWSARNRSARERSSSERDEGRACSGHRREKLEPLPEDECRAREQRGPKARAERPASLGARRRGASGASTRQRRVWVMLPWERLSRSRPAVGRWGLRVEALAGAWATRQPWRGAGCAAAAAGRLGAARTEPLAEGGARELRSPRRRSTHGARPDSRSASAVVLAGISHDCASRCRECASRAR